MDENNNCTPIPINATTMLPSFPSLRDRNLRTLYGDTKIVSSYTNNDKSPKGSVDEKIRPLVDLINRHPDYVTLSSCSGRVALFDPAGIRDDHRLDSDNVDYLNDGGGSDDGDNELIYAEIEEKIFNNVVPIVEKQKLKGTEISGKGRGRWIFVTHDILPDLGAQMIRSLKEVGQERLLRRATGTTKNTINNTNNNNDHDADEPPILFKHEPPLMHIAAASLDAGKKLLHICKGVCAMRESGLVITQSRVTVELRTTGTLLCLPLMIELLMINSSSVAMGEEEAPSSVSLMPNEDYLLTLADMANSRMVQNGLLIGKLFAACREELFEDSSMKESSTARANNDGTGNDEFEVSLQSLPSLNLWKTAAVGILRNGTNKKCDDLDVLAFGGQGAGPVVRVPSGKTPTCRRWDAVFRLTRRDGMWSEHWNTVPSIPSAKDMADNNGKVDDGLSETNFVTGLGTFRVQLAQSLGSREGHCACVVPHLKTTEMAPVGAKSSQAIVLFGGRTGGPSSPSNDLFLYQFCTESSKEFGIFGRPIDTRGISPEPRFGHTMTPLQSKLGASSVQRGEPVAVVAGGTGITTSGGNAVSLSSVYILSCITEIESEFSHFIWGHVSDMPSPRSYHTTFIRENSNDMFVFGGIAEANDPFGSFDDTNGSEEAPLFKIPLVEKSTAHPTSAITTDSNSELSPLVGSSAAAFTLESKDLVLLVGGAKSPAKSDTGHYLHGPLNIFSLQSDGNEISRAQISSIELVNSESKQENQDFGSCVHNCLVALPKPENDANKVVLLVPNDFVIVGGGVPSFSFGQSYARSYLVNIKRPVKCKKTVKPSQHQANNGHHPKSQLVTAKGAQTINGKTMIEADVIYAAARHAKKLKNKLESLGFLDKRYKMVKLSDHDANNLLMEGVKVKENLIAIPVTNHCIETSDLTSASIFTGLMVGRGKEMVPFSSSSMGKMKQQKK